MNFEIVNHISQDSPLIANVTNKLVIAHMTKAEVEYLRWSLLGQGLLFVNQYFNCVVNMITSLRPNLGHSELNAVLFANLFTVSYQPRAAGKQGTGICWNSVTISSCSDKNGATHHGRASLQIHRK
uniref:Uncharacterized protein n=1 Tax=Glossina palpalis gambiensis TaxID=67801 RepID=A0A1B0BXJ0_9MUSC